MSATRLLVLGVVRMSGRAHGYLVHGELVSWGLEEWVNCKWGSIYHALRQLAKEGFLKATEIEEWPGRVDYEMTEQGHAEFLRQLRGALKQSDHRPDLMGAGLALLPALRRDEAIALLKERLRALEAERDSMKNAVDRVKGGDRPIHLRELPRLRLSMAASGADWTRALIERLEGGAYVMADERVHSFGTPLSAPRDGHT
jgi:DNA-binding PadR family transcriptional regulator